MKESGNNLYADTQELPDETAQLNVGDSSIDQDDDTPAESFASGTKTESTSFRAGTTFTKSYIGTGILVLPYNFALLGLGPSLILLAIAAVMNYVGMASLLRVSDTLDTKKLDYPKLNKVILGRAAQIFCEINFLFMQLGVSIAGLVFSIKFLTQISCSLKWTFFCDQEWHVYAIILVMILVTSMITDIHHLAIPMMIGCFLQALFLLSYGGEMISQLANNGVAGGFSNQLLKFDASHLLSVLGVIIYDFEGVGCLLEVRNSIRENTFWKVFRVSFAIVVTLTTLCGVLGSLALGDEANEILFLSMPKTTYFLVLEFGFVVGIFIGVQSILFPILRLIENWTIFRKILTDPTTGRKSYTRRLIVRFGVNIFCFVIAIIIPSYNSFIAFLGSINFSFICFVIPALLFLKHFPTARKSVYGILNINNLILGSIFGAVGGVYNFIQLLKS